MRNTVKMLKQVVLYLGVNIRRNIRGNIRGNIRVDIRVNIRDVFFPSLPLFFPLSPLYILFHVRFVSKKDTPTSRVGYILAGWGSSAPTSASPGSLTIRPGRQTRPLAPGSSLKGMYRGERRKNKEREAKKTF